MPTRGDAFRFLSEEGATIFGDVGSMLYVGHRHDTHPWWWQDFAQKIGAIDLSVVDVCAGNLASSPPCVKRTFLGDLRTTEIPRHGLVFWDEGPEHVPLDEVGPLLRTLLSHHDAVLFSCPWGMQLQGSGPDDPEFHHWAPQPSDFEAMGMTCRSFGQSFDQGGHGNLISWAIAAR